MIENCLKKKDIEKFYTSLMTDVQNLTAVAYNAVDSIESLHSNTLIRNSIFIYSIAIFETSLIQLVDIARGVLRFDLRVKNMAKILGDSSKNIKIEYMSLRTKHRFFELALVILNEQFDLEEIFLQKNSSLKKLNNFLFYKNLKKDRDENLVKVSCYEHYNDAVRKIKEIYDEVAARRNSLIHRSAIIDKSYLGDSKINTNIDLINFYTKNKFYHSTDSTFLEKEVLSAEELLNNKLDVSIDYLDFWISSIKTTELILFDKIFYETHPKLVGDFFNKIVEQALLNYRAGKGTYVLNDCLMLVKLFHEDGRLKTISNSKLLTNIALLIQKSESNLDKTYFFNDFIKQYRGLFKETKFGEFALKILDDKKGDAIKILKNLLKDKAVSKDEIYRETIFEKIYDNSSFRLFFKESFGHIFDLGKVVKDFSHSDK